MIKFDSDICGNFGDASSHEWLETNGIGGFAMSTISGANTRRYHGILTAATRAPLGRITMLSKLDETVVIDDQRIELSSNQFPGKVHPQGFKYLQSFRLDPFPIWTFAIGKVLIEKKIFMVNGENTTVCQWSVVPPKHESFRVADEALKHHIRLEVRPLISFVDYHSLQHQNKKFDPNINAAKGMVKMRPYFEMPEIFFANNAQNTKATGYWYRDFEYSIEKERGFDYTEDLFQPFVFDFDLSETASIIASTEKRNAADAEDLETKELERRERLIIRAGSVDETVQYLSLAADQFIVKRGEGYTIIAGYPWFSDWGRDTMIALNGLTLATNRPEIAKNILLEYSKYISEGMIPNRFPDVGEQPEYNTVDATLWYFEAIRAYIEKTGDTEFLRDGLYEKLAGIMAWHLRGTRYNIHVDTDGLLYAGTHGTQLTWMDAKIGDIVITPRIGKPVEIQALWYNALQIMADLAERFGDLEDKSRYDAMAEMCKQSFNAVFWNEAEQCLFDVVINGSRDASVRPNQVLAVSLPYSMIGEDRGRKIINKAESELLTPVGLRSLSPKDPSYCPIYEGSPFERDSAYHQGTVWGWLIGPFIDGYRRVHKDDADLEIRVTEMLSGLIAHMRQAGIGQISEIFDAQTPDHPRGCPAQAWSVGELLRIIKNPSDN